MKVLNLICNIIWDTLIGIIIIGVAVYVDVTVGQILIGG